MTRTIKLLGAGLVAASGLAVLGVAAWEWQKGLHYYSWQLQPIDEKTAEVKCVGIAGLGLFLWWADNWRCEAVEPLSETKQFPTVLDNPECTVDESDVVHCTEPNQILMFILQDLENEE